MTFNLAIEAVLEKELYSTPPLMPVIVAKFNGTKRDIPKAFKLLRDASTVDLRHLRRIRDMPDGTMECIISKSKYSDGQLSDQEIAELDKKFASEKLFSEYRLTLVPSSAPKTDHQLKACSEIWPCKFSKCNYLIQCIDGSIFTEPEKSVLKIIVNEVINYIKSNPSNHKSAAVIFRCAKIYGIGLSNETMIDDNPIKHSPMISIDSVAANSSAGYWTHSTHQNELTQSIQDKLDREEDLRDHRIDANFLPYLCTNYDIFVTEQPCLMCTMGLVQSRIRRLFYLDTESIVKFTECQNLCYPDQSIEQYLIHREKNLNHRFESWKIRLESD